MHQAQYRVRQTPTIRLCHESDVVATLTRLCLEAGAAKVKVGDNAVGGAVTTYPGSGIEPAVKAAGGEMVYVQDKDLKDLEVNGKRMITWPLFPALLECNLFIDVPVLKDHAITSISSCIKTSWASREANANCGTGICRPF